MWLLKQNPDLRFEVSFKTHSITRHHCGIACKICGFPGHAATSHNAHIRLFVDSLFIHLMKLIYHSEISKSSSSHMLRSWRRWRRWVKSWGKEKLHLFAKKASFPFLKLLWDNKHKVVVILLHESSDPDPWSADRTPDDHNNHAVFFTTTCLTLPTAAWFIITPHTEIPETNFE